MKRTILSLFLVFTILGYATSALAVPYTWTDSMEWTNIQLNTGDSFTYVHDITDSGFIPIMPYEPGKSFDVITNYTLTIDLDILGATGTRSTKAVITIDDLVFDVFNNVYTYNFSMSDNEFGTSFTGLLSLNAYGLLSVTIRDANGSFILRDSNLVANGYDNTAPVPGPGTILLLGAGLAGVGFLRRKARK